MSDVEAAIEALRTGKLAVIPTDTVYGLAADGRSEEAARALYAAKRRDPAQPTALLFASIDALFEELPELPPDAAAVVRALLPGPLTLVLPNARRRFGWLNAARPGAIGVRVPSVAGPGRDVLDALGVLVATSANAPGGRDPRVLGDVPAEIRASAAALVDGGELGGAPSTVVDVTGPEPVVLREGAVPAGAVVARIRAARG